VLSSTVVGRGHLTDEGVEFDNQLQTRHHLDPTSGYSRSGKLSLTGEDAARLKHAAAEKSSSSNGWIVDTQKNVAKDIKEVMDYAKRSELSTGNTGAFAQALVSNVKKYDTKSLQKFNMIKRVVGNADPSTWTSNENQRKILSHMGDVLSGFWGTVWCHLEALICRPRMVSAGVCLDFQFKNASFQSCKLLTLLLVFTAGIAGFG